MDGYLHLEDQTFKGAWIGNPPQHDVKGEVVFFTGMTGYQEVLTDPSYKGQIVVFTYPMIGNYGINKCDAESMEPQPSGVVVYEAESRGFHYESEMSIGEYLQQWNIPLLSHIDTRAVVKRIRKSRSMPALLSSNEQALKVFPSKVEPRVPLVSTTTNTVHGNGEIHIILMDFGLKKSILNSLLIRGCKVTVVPYNTTFEKITSLNPDGVLLSNGPGDPKELTEFLPHIKKIVEHFPALGICLGHQLIALAYGADTNKMHFGHRGANQPVLNCKNGKVFMSSQNHSYVVDELSLQSTGLSPLFVNCNDGTIEGLLHQSLPIITAQFHPEAHPGPRDSEFIFEDFLNLVQTSKRRAINYA